MVVGGLLSIESRFRNLSLLGGRGRFIPTRPASPVSHAKGILEGGRLRCLGCLAPRVSFRGMGCVSGVQVRKRYYWRSKVWLLSGDSGVVVVD